MKVIVSLWFTSSQGCIGIIVGEDDTTGDRKAYIGIGHGLDERADTKAISALGSKFSLDTAQKLVTLLTKKEG